nr:hypothetical protein [Neobacillus sp. Marseille-Q6967]
MGLQTGAVSMVALGVDNHSTLTPGVHLHWTTDATIGFPPGGFEIYRRLHRPGTPKTYDFRTHQVGNSSMPIKYGPAHWSTTDPSFQSEFTEVTVGGVRRTVLRVPKQLTCQFDKSEGPIRKIEIRIVNTLINSHSTRKLSLWGTSGGRRVTPESSLILSYTQSVQELSLSVSADSLDGFQLSTVGYSPGCSFMQFSWTVVSDEAEVDWGKTLNPRRIGFPVSSPGYLVNHAYSPDSGTGDRDWLEAADRLSPTGVGSQLAATLVKRFGMPVFLESRKLFQEALAGGTFSQAPAGSKPKVTLGSADLVRFSSIDPDFSRMAGLGYVDRLSVNNTRYDYKLVGYWPGPSGWKWKCTDVPGGGTTPGGGGGIPIPGGGGIPFPGGGGIPIPGGGGIPIPGGGGIPIPGGGGIPIPGGGGIPIPGGGGIPIPGGGGIPIPGGGGIPIPGGGGIPIPGGGGIPIPGGGGIPFPSGGGVPFPGGGILPFPSMPSLPQETLPSPVPGMPSLPRPGTGLPFPLPPNNAVLRFNIDENDGTGKFDVTVRGITAPIAATLSPAATLKLPNGFTIPAIPGFRVTGIPSSSETGGIPIPTTKKSITITLPAPAEKIRVTARSSAGMEPLVLMAMSDQKIVDVRTNSAGMLHEVEMTGSNITSVVVSGSEPTVTRICRWVFEKSEISHAWICFDVRRTAVPSLMAPSVSGIVIPGLSKPGKSVQMVGIRILEPQEPPIPDLYPIGKNPLDAVVFEVARREDGSEANGNADSGQWKILSDKNTWTDMVAAFPQQVLRSSYRPKGHRPPEGWPSDPPDILDDRLDSSVRYYSYRVRSRDLFGRMSAWSSPFSIDSSDKIPPPPPAGISARWLEASDSWLSSDDLDVLNSSGTTSGVRVRWSWSKDRQEQAPDTAMFRVYWNDEPFTSIKGSITSVQAVGSMYTLQVSIPKLSGALVVDAFKNDWLRQGVNQYRVLSSTASNPATINVSASGMPLPALGSCTIALRQPDLKRHQLLRHPLYREPASSLTWGRRVLQVPHNIINTSVQQQSLGAKVNIEKVIPNHPRPKTATIWLTRDWLWSGLLQDQLALIVGGTSYPVVGGTLGRSATLVIDTSIHQLETTGSALLQDGAGLLRTIVTPANISLTGSFQLVGGTLDVGQAVLPVLAHKGNPALQLVVYGNVGSNPISWFPDYEAFISGVTLPVSPKEPQTTGLIGVSAVDNCPFTVDKRQKPGEPAGPGNESPIVSVGVQRVYRGAPTQQSIPEGTVGSVPLWASPPNEFSGVSMFELRWPKVAGASHYHVLIASVDAVLNKDMEDRARALGAYKGQPPLSGQALTQWRKQQEGQNVQSLQSLATLHKEAFTYLSEDPLSVSDPLLQDPAKPNMLKWKAPLDGKAPGRFFLRVAPVDEAGNAGPLGPSTLPIMVPDTRRPQSPLIRRIIPGNQHMWIFWDTPDLTIKEYGIYRTPKGTELQPDVRDMTLVTTISSGHCPEPLAVFGGAVTLSGEAPYDVVAIFLAHEYDPKKDPDSQSSIPLTGTFTLDGMTIEGLNDFPDGTLVFPVVRYTSGEKGELAVSKTGRAFRDSSVPIEIPQIYRIEGIRQAVIGQGSTLPVRSFASEPAEGMAFDLRLPESPIVQVVWDPNNQAVQVTWSVSNLPPNWEMMLQRSEEGFENWRGVSDWIPSSKGVMFDSSVKSGDTYSYRLRVRDSRGRLSQNETIYGPISIP